MVVVVVCGGWVVGVVWMVVCVGFVVGTVVCVGRVVACPWPEVGVLVFGLAGMIL